MSKTRRNIWRLVAAVTTSAALVGIAAMPAEAVYRGSSLTPGEELHHETEDHIARRIANGEIVRLRMQADGNLVLRNGASGRACWASNTRGHGDYAAYQGDGNFVVYDLAGNDVWASGKKDGNTVDINSEGVLYVGFTPISPKCES